MTHLHAALADQIRSATMEMPYSLMRGVDMGEILFIQYPRCSTCKKAKAWLDSHGIAYTSRDITEDNPTKEELKAWKEASGLPVRRFFNTSGKLYRELNVKKLLDAGMKDDEVYALLATDGMLVKRPILLIDGVPLTPGFKEAEWAEKLL